MQVTPSMATPGYQPYPHQTVEIFAIGIYGCLVTLVVGIVDRQ